jgi:RecA-family ATPase
MRAAQSWGDFTPMRLDGPHNSKSTLMTKDVQPCEDSSPAQPLAKSNQYMVSNITKSSPEIHSRTLDEFMKKDWPEVEYLVDPWLPTRGLIMLWGWRGVGKTFTTLSIALSIASGQDFLDWPVPEARKVLYVDGEMDPAEQRDKRFRKMLDAMDTKSRDLALQNLAIVTHADFEFGIPDLADPSKNGRKIIEAEAERRKAKLIILDNLSSLMSGDEKDDQSWKPMQDWMLELRRKGYAVMYLHHGTKPNESGRSKQRGTSKREDILNTSIELWRPSDFDKSAFSLDFSKTRGWPAGEPLTLQICDDGWVRAFDPDAEKAGLEETVVLFHDEGWTYKEIKAQLNIGESTIASITKKHKARAAEGAVAA